jgi:hypothetical protein
MKRHFIIILLSLFSIYSWGQSKYDLKGEIGILEWTGKLDKNVAILNEDGTEWMKFNFIDESNLFKQEWTQENDSLSKINHRFDPLLFDLWYLRLYLRVFEIKDSQYKVEVDKDVYKYISVNNNWQLRNWGQHIAKHVAIIGFESNLTPIYEAPNETSKVISKSGAINPQIFPIDSKGEWLKIQYTIGESEMTGWVKWKSGNKILIELYYET